MAVVILVLGYALHRSMQNEKSDSEYRREILLEYEHLKLKNREVYEVLDHYVGGVYKRIDEIREITESIQRHQPDLFLKELGLIHWLSASDQFLCQIRDVAMPEGQNSWQDEQRQRFANSGRTDVVYKQVRDLLAQ
jgi:hypothetical protein